MKFKTTVILFAFLACVSFGRAEIIGDMDYSIWDDGDGVLSCTYDMTEDDPIEYDDYSLDIDGDHFRPRWDWEPGHLLGWFKPGHSSNKTIKVSNILRNCTELEWTDYHIDVTMENDFTISAADVIIPANWPSGLIEVIQPEAVGDYYVGSIDYYVGEGTPVIDGQTLKVKYSITFSGQSGCQHNYWQQLTPTPEPGTLVLLACGLVGLLFIRRRFA